MSSIDGDILRDCQEIYVAVCVVGKAKIRSLDNRALNGDIVLDGRNAPTKEIRAVDCVVLEGYFGVTGELVFQEIILQVLRLSAGRINLPSSRRHVSLKSKVYVDGLGTSTDRKGS